MTNHSIVKVCLFGLLSTYLFPSKLIAQGLPGTIKSYEDDRIKVVVQDCSRKQQDLLCQATLMSKSSDRTVELNGSTIKIVDAEGNEYYPSNLRIANRTSENNSIKTDLIENVPFKATFTFSKVPASLTQIVLLQVPLGATIGSAAKFRNFSIVDSRFVREVSTSPENLRQRSSAPPSDGRNTTTPKPVKTSIAPTKSTNSDSETNIENISVCPDNTKILYRATSKSYLLYICGTKNPTHYVGMSKDSTQGITLRLRYFDRTQFSADNGDTNYTIAANRLVIRKDNKVIYQEKIQVLQALPGTTIAEETIPQSKPRKKSPSAANNGQNRSSTSQPVPKIKRQTTNAE
jgi:hypothetical protein